MVVTSFVGIFFWIFSKEVLVARVSRQNKTMQTSFSMDDFSFPTHLRYNLFRPVQAPVIHREAAWGASSSSQIGTNHN
jgi:hypothetical protein